MSTYTMRFDSQMTEDYILTAGIPTLTSSPSPIAVLMNAKGNTELLAIHADGELYHVIREPLSESGWNFFGIGAGLAAVAALSSTKAWALGNDNQFWIFSTNRWTQVRNALPGQATVSDLSAGFDGTVWALDSSNQLYQYSSDGIWQPQNVGLQIAPRGTTQDMWAISANGMTHWTGGQWSDIPLPDSAVPSTFSVAPDGTLWVLGGANGVITTLYQRTADVWRKVPLPSDGLISQLAAADANELWAIVTDTSQYSAWLEHYSGGQWQKVSDAPAPTVTPNLPAISMSSDGALWLLDQAATIWRREKNSTTWQRRMNPTGMHGYSAGLGVTEVVAGEDRTGTWSALYVQNEQVMYAQYSGGVWTTPQAIPGGMAGNIGITRNHSTGELVGYGSSITGNFLVILIGLNGWTTAAQYEPQPGLSLVGVKTNLSVVNDDFWVTTAVIDSTLCQAYGSKSAPLTFNNEGTGFVAVADSQNPNQIWNHMKEVIRLPWVQFNVSDPYAAVIDQVGNIYMVVNMGMDPAQGYSLGTYLPLSGSGIAPFGSATIASALLDDNEMVRIYATDANSKLWLIRQTGTTNDTNNPWTWTMWHPLGNECQFLANGPGRRTTTELYIVSPDNTLAQLAQNPTTKSYVARQLKRPAGVKDESDYVTQYTTEITVIENGGIPAAYYPVSVTVQEEESIWCGGNVYNLAPNQPLTLTADRGGKLRITRIATGLHAAALAIQGSDLTNPQQIYPPQQVHNYLAGSGSLPGKPQFTSDGGALLSAQSQSGSSFDPPSPMSPGLNSSTAGAVAGTVQDIFKMNPQHSGGRGLVRLRSVAGAVAGDAGSESFWQELADYAEDLNHAIENGIITIKDVSRNIEEKTVSLTLSIEHVADQVVDFVIHTVQDAVNALHNVFKLIVNKLEQLIDWVKSLFEWGDIWNSKQVFEFAVQESVAALQWLLEDGAQVEVDGFFSGLKARIDTDLATAKQLLKGKTFSDLVPGTLFAHQAPGRPPRPYLQPDDLEIGGAREMWLIRKILANLNDDSGYDSASLNMLDDAVNDLTQSSAIQNAVSDLQRAFQDLLAIVKNAVTDPEAFKASGVSDFLDAVNAVVDFALDLAQAIVKAFLDLVSDLLQNIDQVLTQPLDIPLVSPLYESITEYLGNKDELTILNCATLAMALPFTVAYKILNNTPPFTDDQVKMIQNQGFLPPSAALAQRMGVGTEDVNWGIVYAVWSGIVALSDSGSDYIAAALVNADGKSVSVLNSAVKFAGYNNAFALSFMQYMAWKLLPNPDSWNWSQMPDEERWTKGAWIAAWAPPILNTIWLSVPVLATLDRAELAGQILLTVTGAVNLGVGVTAAAMAGNENDIIENVAIAIAANASATMTPLLMEFAVDATEGDSAGFKGWSDPFFDILGGVLMAAAAAASPLSRGEAVGIGCGSLAVQSQKFGTGDPQ